MPKNPYQTSVIIVNYNAGQHLLQAVQSVLKLTGVEVVVIDNNSQDGSFEELIKTNKSNNLLTITSDLNLGFGKATNLAVSKSHGDYLLLLNPDATLTPEALAQLIKTSKEFGHDCIIAPRLVNMDGTPQRSCYHQQSISNAISEYWLGKKGCYSKYLPTGKNKQVVHAAVAAAWLMRRDVWDKLGGFCERFFLYFEDLDLCDRANKAGIRIVYDPTAIVKHAHGISSQTNTSTHQLFLESALEYHGHIKKYLLDAIIITGNIFTPPYSAKKLTAILCLLIILIYTLSIAF